MKFAAAVALSLTVLLAACGGGGSGSEPTMPTSPVVTTPSPSPEVVPHRFPVVPTLLLGSHAPLEVAGYTMSSLRMDAGAFVDLPAVDCVGETSFATNKVTGLTEIYCTSGATYRYDSSTNTVGPGAAIPKFATHTPSVLTMNDGTVFFARGVYNYPMLASDSELITVSVGGTKVESVPLPDRADNTVPIKMGVTSDSSGKEKVIVVTQSYDSNSIAISRFDVMTRRFEGTCKVLARAISVSVDNDGVMVSLRRGLSELENDALLLDPATCVVKQEYRIPVTEYGIPLAQFVVVTNDAVFLGGGTSRGAAPVLGVWKFDKASGRVLGMYPTTALPVSGTYAKGTHKLYVSTDRDQVLEIGASTMTLERVFSKNVYGGELFFVE